ncbi:hypothetical protein LguiA_034926 [Lonicera macranthoides]
MWMEGNKHGLGLGYSRIQTPANSSWEEQAFAEDSRGPLGGFVWPPRSYSCSFCKREFRSAQALGGHMNVHRRDRARLKQSLINITPQIDHHHDHDDDQQITKSGLSSQLSSLDNYCSPSFLGHNDVEYCVATNLCIGPTGGDEGNIINCKRRKTKAVLEPLDLVLKPLCSNESMEEVDLELRLGG